MSGSTDVLASTTRAVLSPLAAIAAFAFAFGTFGSALWTNIYVDGHPDVTTWSTFLADLPVTAFFLVPGIAVVPAARVVRANLAQRVFGVTAIAGMSFLTVGYALAPVAALVVVWAVWNVVRTRRLGWPPLDVIAAITGPVMFWFFAYAEAHR